MSKIKITKATKNNVASMKIINRHQTLEVECWSYPDRVLFYTGGEAIDLTWAQTNRIFKFLEKGKIK